MATTYEWNAENRLRAVYPTFPESADDLKTTFAYDYRGRRVEKRVVAWDPDPGIEDWETDAETHVKFIWDGWKLLMELACTQPDCGTGFQPVKKYTWGLDLAGQNGQINSLEAAGTIGGLLAVHDADASTGPAGGDGNYFVLSDANGNVGQLVAYSADVLDDAQPPQTLGTAWHAYRLAAHYEYAPYGNVVTQTGPYADDNPIRYSTKYWDDETGLGYWGYRYYSPTLGRWISRDPIGESGGVNLYHYAVANPISVVDPVGLEDFIYEYDEDKHYSGSLYVGWGGGVELTIDKDREQCCLEGGRCTWKKTEHINLTLEAGLGLGVDVSAGFFNLSFQVKALTAELAVQCDWDYPCGQPHVQGCRKCCGDLSVNVGGRTTLGAGVFLLGGLEGELHHKVSGSIRLCFLKGKTCPQEGVAAGFCGSYNFGVSYSMYVGGKRGRGSYSVADTGCWAFIGRSEMLE